MVLPRLSGSIELDGLSNEPAWEILAPLPATMYQPVFQGEMTERTEFRIAYDDNYLYVAGRFYDTDPGGILTSSLYRDGGTFADDYLNVVIDPFNDNENALWFWTTPAGIRGDMAVSNDNEGESALNESWDTFWDVATVTTEEGWFVEVRIPFSSLGFQAKGNRVVMGMALSRVIARKNERHVFPAIPPDWERGFAKPSLAQDVVLRGIASQKPIYFTPYMLGGGQRATVQAVPDAPYEYENDFTRDIGLDVKYNLTSNLTLDVTVNTDFAQVEADEAQINLGRFSLFFPEKRPFFQERAGIFDYAFDAQERLFHSRRIGLTDAGEPVPILGGTRLVGRLGAWDLGLIDMQTARSHGQPSENFGIFRLRRQLFNTNSFAGGIATSRIDEAGNHNLVYGLDGLFRVTGDEYLTVKWAQSFDSGLDRFRFDKATFVQMRWQRRRQKGFNYMVWLTRWGADFQPKMGFYTRRDYSQTLGRIAYGWFPGSESVFRRFEPVAFANVYFRNDDGAVETGVWGISNTLEWKSGANLLFEMIGHYEDLRSPLSFPENTDVPVGDHTFYRVNLRYDTASGRRYRTILGASLGSFYDGTRTVFRLSPTWNVSKHLELSTTYQTNFVRFPDRDQRFDAHLLQFRAQVALNTRVSASAFVQYNSAADLFAVNARFRYNFGERNDLWIVYNENLYTDQQGLEHRRPLSQSRVVLLKYTHTLGL